MKHLQEDKDLYFTFFQRTRGTISHSFNNFTTMALTIRSYYGVRSPGRIFQNIRWQLDEI